MVGMLQILTYMFAFYLVLKGVEILQIAAASGRENRGGIILWGVIVLLACCVAAVVFIGWQENMARSVSAGMRGLSP